MLFESGGFFPFSLREKSLPPRRRGCRAATDGGTEYPVVANLDTKSLPFPHPLFGHLLPEGEGSGNQRLP